MAMLLLEPTENVPTSPCCVLPCCMAVLLLLLLLPHGLAFVMAHGAHLLA